MRSLSPDTPGSRQQIPRTINSILQPACEAAYNSSIIPGSTSEFIFMVMCPVVPLARLGPIRLVSSLAPSSG
jgi:hypothetical protein